MIILYQMVFYALQIYEVNNERKADLEIVEMNNEESFAAATASLTGSSFWGTLGSEEIWGED